MKLTKRKMEYIVRNRKKGMSTYMLGKHVKVTERRINQVLLGHKRTGKMPVLGRNLGRPRIKISAEERSLVLDSQSRYDACASYLERIIKNKYSLSINHNRIHRVLLEEGLAHPIGMKIRKKKWVRYERKHSLSAVHMDWAYDPKIEKWIIAVLDDASRMILAFGEYDHASVENTVEVLKRALQLGHINEVITDHGPQFTANKTDKKGNANSQFAEFCKEHKIKQILCRIKHPQSNGKIERWFGLYRQKRHHYETTEAFVYWYNHVKPHASLNFEELETPAQAFRRKFKK